jgi:hypothetical protein
MKSILKLASASLLVLAATACKQDLVVENLSNPDIGRVFATPSSVEATIGAGYQTVHNALSATNRQPEVEVMGLESFSQLNNFNMVQRVSVPRLPIANAPGSPSVLNEFSALSKEARLVVNAMDALEALNKNNLSIATPARDKRARSFGFFVTGVSLGWLAMIYDSAAVVNVHMKSDSIPPLSPAADVMKAALVQLDTALAIANDPAAASAFPLEGAWFSGTTLSLDSYKRLIRSYKARFRAGVARTPTQRTAVDWNAVIADAENGLSSDLMVTVGGTSGWNLGFITQRYVDSGWSEMSMLYLGMADVSGAYAQFIATPFSQRNGWFLVITPDQRWPQGTTRAAQNTVSSVQPATASSKPYISNRSVSNDVAGAGWGISFYDYYRYKYIKNASNIGLFPEFMKAETDLVAAEGYIRTGNVAAAAAKIDLTRVKNGGLPALTGVITSATQAVPGDLTSCVPQVPSGATVSCGNILEAMKYEMRMETAYSSWGRYWLDSRGWGDLIESTALEYPVPYEEMQSRQRAFYNLGGGSPSSATKGTYGF